MNYKELHKAISAANKKSKLALCYDAEGLTYHIIGFATWVNTSNAFSAMESLVLFTRGGQKFVMDRSAFLAHYSLTKPKCALTEFQN
jgi:hypothetical protein